MIDVEKIESTYTDFIVKLRMAEGFDFSLFESLCMLLNKYASENSESSVIPKQLGMMFVDAQVAMLSSADLYPEKEREEILMAADKLADILRYCSE